MSALRDEHTGSPEQKSNNIPLYPEPAGYDNATREKRTSQVILFITAGTMQAFINNLRDDYITFCDQYAAGKKTMQENIAYTIALAQKLRENNVPFDIFVRATV